MVIAEQYVVQFDGDTHGFDTAVGGIRGKLDAIASQVSLASAALAGLFAKMGTDAAMVGIGFDRLREQAMTAFTSLLGSAQAAKGFLGELADFAARTPFEFPDLIKAAQKFTAMGFAAKDVIPTLTAVGDAVAAMGGSAEMIDRVSLALVQMKAKGKVSAEEMRQLAEAGIPAWDILAQKIGKTIPETMKLAEKGAIDATTAIAALTEGMEKRFGGMMEKQARTFQGLISTLKDTATQALGDVLQPLFDKLRDAMQKAVDVLPKAVQWFQTLSPEIKNAALALAGIATFAPVIATGFGLIAGAISALLSPIGLVIGAVAALAVAYSTNLGGIRDTVNRLVDDVEQLWSAHGQKVITIVGAMWNVIVDEFGRSMQMIALTIDNISAVIEGRWFDLWSNMGNILKNALFSMLNIFPSVMRAIADFIGKITEAITGTNWTDAARKMVQNAEGGIADAFRSFDMATFNLFGQRAGEAAGLSFQDIFLRHVQASERSLSTKFDPATMAAAVTGQAQPITDAEKKAAQLRGDQGLKRLFGIDPPALASAAKKAGGGVGKALLDGFQTEGGLDAAISLISNKTTQLASLFDPITKKMKPGAEELKRALSEVARSVNEFLAAAGTNVKLTAADVAEKWGQLQGVLSKTDAFERVKTALESLNVERAVQGLQTFDSTLKVNGDQLVMSGGAIDAFKERFPLLEIAVRKAGLVISTEFPKAADSSKAVGFALKIMADEAKEGMTDFAFETKDKLGKAKLAFDEFVSTFPIARLKAQLKEMKESVENSLDFSTVKVKNEAADLIHSIISEFEKEGERMGLTGEALMNHVLEGVKKVAPGLTGEMKTAADDVVKQWQLSLYKLPGIWDDVFNKLGVTAKKWAASVFGVLDSIPGAFGSAVKKVSDTINQWVSFFDKVLGLLHKFSADVPASFADLFSKVIGIFKTTQSAVSTVASGIGASAGLIIKNFTGGADALIPTIATGSATATTALHELGHSGSEALGKLGATAKTTAGGISSSFAQAITVFGALTAAVGVFASTFQSDSKAVRFAGGFLLGGPIGGILSAIFGGPSDFEKQKRALQLDQLRANVQQTAQAVVSAAIEGFQKALAFFDQLDQFTNPRKAKFQQFFKSFDKLMDFFVEEAKKFQDANLTKMKDVAEAFGSIAGAIANAPAAFDAINSSFTIPESQFNIFFGNLDAFMNRFFARADVWIDGTAKRAGKVADRLAPVVNIIEPFVNALKAMVDLKPVGEDALNTFDSMLMSMVQHLGKIADSFDKGWIKTLNFFAEKVGAGLDIWIKATDAIRSMVDLPVVKDTQVDVLAKNLKMFIDKLANMADTMDMEAVAKAASLATSITPITNAIQAWAQAAGLIKDYSGVAAETWDKILADFNRAIHLIDMMLGSAIDFLPKAVQFEDVMRQIAEHLGNALGFFGTGLSQATSAFLGVVNAIEGGVPIGTGPGGSLEGGQARNFIPSSAGRAGNTTVVVNVNAGMVVRESELPGMTLNALVELQKAGRLKLNVA